MTIEVKEINDQSHCLSLSWEIIKTFGFYEYDKD